ncbi:MAG: competence type IV pilus minor pilin ComGF [Bacillota bacterium]
MYRNNNGFTMIELLLTIQVTILTTILLSMLIPFMKPPSSYHSFQVYQFLGSLEKEIQTSQHVHIDDHTLSLTSLNGDIITINQYQHVIRRQVNGRGHEILLRDVAAFTLTEKDQIQIIIKTTEEALFYDTVTLFHSG